MRYLRISFEYLCWPIWEDDPKNPGDIDPKDFPISKELRKRIYALEAEFDATLNQDYPPDSKFPSEEAKWRFWLKAYEVYEDLCKELGNQYSIRFFDMKYFEEAQKYFRIKKL